MTAFPTTLAAVVPSGASLIIRFRHPADRQIPIMEGFGFGEEWVTLKAVRRWTQALCAAAGQDRPGLLANKPVEAFVNDGVLISLAFPDTGKRVVFSEVCHS